MANSLLDFVVSLVRDPEVAARYAADPARAIADANLTGVTSADVNNLIPMVTESLPVSGDPLVAAESAANVWTSGAATTAFEAFDAFDEPLPEPVIDDSPALDIPVIDQGASAVADELSGADPAVSTLDDASLQLEQVIDDDAAVTEVPTLDDWTGVVTQSEPLDDASTGFDLFD